MAVVLYNPNAALPNPEPPEPIIPGHKVPYKGLGNQGATCYMNSLLQSLFMIPEFRLMIYNWIFDEAKHGLKLYSIPYQLQSLFAQLQIGYRSYVKTKDLASSFDWDITELTIQQDIQEFFIVLLDAIEQSDIEKAINPRELFGVLVLGSIKCKECGNKSIKQELCMNVSLPINDPFTQTCNSSLEMALENYLKPEILSDANAYACESCNKKVEASKGLEFGSLPLILTIQLNRFTLDMETLLRVKIKDRITFPFMLNMNNYMQGYDGIKKRSEDYMKELEEELKILERSVEKPKEEPNETKKQQEEQPKGDEKEEIKAKEVEEEKGVTTEDYNEYKISYKDEKVDIGKVASELGVKGPINHTTEPMFEYDKELISTMHKTRIEEYLKDGPDVYELFSVTVHRGEAFHGHYYVYIKSFEDDYWYKFDDSTVSLATEHDVIKTYGDSSNFTCAYMLMYRRVGVAYPKIDVEAIPKYLVEEIEKERSKEQEKEKARQEELRKISVTLNYNETLLTIRMERDATLKKLKETAITRFNIKTTSEDCMLKALTKERSLIESYFPDKDEFTLDKLSISSCRDYVLETKDADGKFKEDTEEEIILKMIVYSPEYTVLEENSLPSKSIPIKKSAKIRELINLIAEDLKVEAKHEQLRVLRRKQAYQDSFFESIFYEEAMDNTLREMNINDDTCIYVETIKTEEDSKASRWSKALEEDKAKIVVYFNNPYEDNGGCNDKIIISKNDTVGYLKELIGSRFNIKPNEFVLHRITSNGPELKDLTAILGGIGIERIYSLFVKFGNPTAADECRISVTEAILVPEERNDMNVYEYKYWRDIPVLPILTALQLKEKIAEELKADKNIEVSPKQLRIREKTNDSEGRVLIDTLELTSYDIYEGKAITYQILDHDESLEVDNLIIAVKDWNPEDWSLDKGTEIIINPHWRLHDLAYKLSDHFPYYRNRIEQLSITRVTHTSDFKRSELTNAHVLFINKVVGNVV